MPSILLFLQDRTSSIEFDLRNLAPYATSFSQFLAEKLGVKIRVPLSYHKEGGQKWIPRSLEVLILSVLGFSIIFFLGHQLLRSVVDFSWKDLGGVAGILFIFFVGVSGTIFSLLREIPPFGYNPLNGDVFFAAPSLHQQFSVEGIVMGAMMIWFGFSLISINHFISTTRPLRLLPCRLLIAFLGLVMSVFTTIVMIMKKMPGYGEAILSSQSD